MLDKKSYGQLQLRVSEALLRGSTLQVRVLTVPDSPSWLLDKGRERQTRKNITHANGSARNRLATTLILASFLRE